MALNQDQKEAERKLLKFLAAKDQKEFSISGPAGVGKTFFMGHVVSETLQEFYDTSKLLGNEYTPYNPVFTATTHKAAQALRAATGREVKTIHSHIAVKPVKDFDTGRKVLKKTGNWEVHSRQMVFIDEASMIDSRLYELINQAFDKTCKIIYLGDHCQLAPVMEDLSLVYANPLPSAQLNQPMRNAGQPALMALCNQLRDTVETGIFHPIQEVPGVIDHLDEAQAQTYIDQTFVQEGADARVLAYSNPRVMSYLEHIRNIRGYPTEFVPGERVINNEMFILSPDLAIPTESELEVIEKVKNSHLKYASTNSDKDACFEVYTLAMRRGNSTFQVNVPSDPEHYRQLLKYLAARKEWRMFYQLKESIPDLRPTDASTVHKSQGSTYDEVFLDLTNIGSCTSNSEIARMLYVGASRARNRVVLWGELPARLFQQAA